jgi:hypothetical protein
LHHACCFNYFFNIPTNARNIYASKSTKIHIKTLNTCPFEKKWEHNEAVYQLFIDFKKAYDSVRREALYNILVELVSPRNW